MYDYDDDDDAIVSGERRGVNKIGCVWVDLSLCYAVLCF